MSFSFRCRTCATQVVDEDVDLVEGRFRCRFCGSISRSVKPSGIPTPRDLPPLPRNMSVGQGPDHLFLSIRWFHPLHLLWIAAVVALDVGMLSLFRTMSAHGVHWTAYLLGPMVYNLLAVAGNYLALAVLLNRTHVSIRGGFLRVVQLPLPCARSMRVPAAEVDQIFTRADYQERQVRRCHVCVRRRDGRYFTLVKNLRRLEQALFLERAVEIHLGIPDEPIAGEVPR